MTQEEILKGNRLIADFMEVDYSGKFQYIARVGYTVSLSEEHLQYNSSWDWLIPVFQKIEKLGYGWSIVEGEIDIYSSGYQWITHSREIVDENTTLIEAAFKCCVDFIEKCNNDTLTRQTK
jgi:hypothetical protein